MLMYSSNSPNHRTLNRNNGTIPLKFKTYYITSCNLILYLILCKFVVVNIVIAFTALAPVCHCIGQFSWSYGWIICKKSQI